MRTKPARSDEERLRAFNDLLDQPSIVEIDDATAYWLEGEDGQPIGEESPTSEAPLLAALAEIRRGVDPNGLSLVCHVPDDDVLDDGRYVIASGDFLVEFAEWAAGIPARPRTPAPGESPGRSGKGSRSRIGSHVGSFTRPLTPVPPPAQAASPGSGARRPRGR